MSENLAESVNVKMVCFRNVAYQDDGLRPYSSSLVPYGFQTLDATDVTGYTYESDGDIGIIHTGTGSSNGYVTYAKYCTHSTIPILNSTLAIVRGKCLTGNAKWSTQIYYNDESGNTMSTWNTNTEFTDFYYTIPTGTLTLFNIKVQTTDGADASAAFDYVLLSSNTPMTLTPSDMDIENVLTEGYDTADFTCSYNDVNIDLNPRVSDHIKIWESKESTVNLKKIFTGFIESTELKANGKEHMWINSNASGYGKYLAERKVKINRSTFANELVLLALNPVISTGKITAYNLPTSTEVITVKTEEKYEPILDIIKNNIITSDSDKNKLDWDMYVDYGSDLHMFKIGTITSTINIAENNMFTFDYEENINRMVNKQFIVGYDGRSGGGDDIYTESTSNWGIASGMNLSADTLIPSYIKEGSHYLWFAKANYNPGDQYWFERTLNPHVNMVQGGHLKMWITHRAVITIPIKKSPIPAEVYNSLSVNLYFFTDDNNYFYNNFKVEGGHICGMDDVPGAYSPGIREWRFQGSIDLPIGQVSNSDWGTWQYPDWEDISKIRLEIAGPVSTTGGTWMVTYLDAMTISNLKYYATYDDLDSQKTYGIKEGNSYTNPQLINFEECTIAASLLVNAYKDPTKIIKNFEISNDKIPVDLGTEYVFNTLGVDCTVGVRKINWNVENLQLTKSIELADKYIPKQEYLLATFQRQLEKLNHNTELWKKKTGIYALDESKGKTSDWWDQDPTMGIHTWIASKSHLIQGAEATSFYSFGSEGSNHSHSLGEIKLWVNAGFPTAKKTAGIMTGNTSNGVNSLNYQNTFGVSFDFKVDSINDNTYEMIGSGGSTDNPPTNFSFVGVELDGSYLNAKVRNNSNQTTLNIGVLEADSIYSVKFLYYPNDKVNFYLNGAYRGSITTTMPEANMALAVFYTESELPYTYPQTLSIYTYQIGEYVP